MRVNPRHAQDAPVVEPEPIRVPVLGRLYTIRLLSGRMIVNGRAADYLVDGKAKVIEAIDPGDSETLADGLACALAAAFGVERRRKVRARRAARERRRRRAGGERPAAFG